MPDLARLGTAMQRVATALLRGTGGRTVCFLMPVAATEGNLIEELGLPTTTFDEIELGPVTLRGLSSSGVVGKAGERWELLAGAEQVSALAGAATLEEVLAVLTQVAGVMVDGVRMQVESVGFSDVGGVPYVYRFVLRAPASATT